MRSIHEHPAVVALNRSNAEDEGRLGAGAEAGLDPHNKATHARYQHIQQECTIDVVDYAAQDCKFHRMGNDEFIESMQKDTGKLDSREDWVKVRWVSIGGIDFNVVLAVALKYGIHSLAVEDIIDTDERVHNQSQADYYQKHLFIRVLAHSLRHSHNSDSSSSNEQPNSSDAPIPMYTQHADSSSKIRGRTSPAHVNEELKPARPKILNKRPFASVITEPTKPTSMSPLSMLSSMINKRHLRRQKQKSLVDTLKNSARVDVETLPMFIALYRDGTVITIHQDPNLELTSPITARLSRPDTYLRTSGDASLLVQAILDLTVDRILEIIDEYQERIYQLEHDILLKPTMSIVRRLHILSGDLILHKQGLYLIIFSWNENSMERIQGLNPIKNLIHSLRKYDLQRYLAVSEGGHDMDQEPSRSPSVMGQELENKRAPAVFQPIVNRDAMPVREGYMSQRTIVYLADVYDHMDFVLTSLDMFAGISENLINYAFNMASYEINEVMRRLTLATMIFLPLTLLTGYFGMNFDSPWLINGHSDLVFWEIALPMLALVIPLFLLPDILKLVRYIRRWMMVKRAYMTHPLRH